MPQAQYGPDAQRTVVWLAASCNPRAIRAAAQQHRQPSYYGGAWLALGRALLTARVPGTC